VLRDWSLGKLARYTTASAPAPSSDNAALDVAKLYTNDEPILASLKTRKEMRKAGGVVKFSAGAVETRKVAVDEPWVGLAGEDDEDEGEESEGDDSEVGQDEEDEDEENESEDELEEMDEGGDTDDDEDDEEDTPPPPSNKQKRKRGTEPAPPAPPSKRVAFAADPKTSNQARKAESLKLKAQQQKPAPIPAKKVEEPKQPLKAVETAKSKLLMKEKKVVEKKVANVAAKKAKGSKPAKSPTTEGPEAYDFSKFF
jgi:nuclear GTP-binding protein